jgi:SAM-dependent methyltransferase
MIGQATAVLEWGPRRWLQAAWGSPNLHARQKWRALWPRISALTLPNLRVLDAGCGSGDWALEIAKRRNHWSVVGLDRDASAIEIASRRQAKLGLANVRFVHADFRDFEQTLPFDLILSVASAHYLIGDGHGRTLFGRFREWSRAGGHLILLCGRPETEVPYARYLPRPALSPGVGGSLMHSLCAASGWEVEDLCPCVGRLGTIAKQLTCGGAARRGLALFSQPWAYACDFLDRTGTSVARRSSFHILIARCKA